MSSTAAGLSLLVPSTLADRIFDAIIVRELESGARLIETELSTALQVSRVPVREAIRILHSLGLIIAAPRRGMRVAQFDGAWAQQLHEARVAMGRLCARTAGPRLRRDPEALARMRSRLADLITTSATGDWQTINRADVAFHTTLFELAGSPLLMTLWTAIARHVLIMFSIETYRDQNYHRIIVEHQTYLDALLKGPMSAIEAEIGRHVAGNKIFADTAH